MKVKRICKICGATFFAIKVTQYFDSRRCFKKDYYLRVRGKEVESKKPHFPVRRCGFCEKSTQLTFDPIKNHEALNSWFCPHCGVTNKDIWENQHNVNSYQVIKHIILVRPIPVIASSSIEMEPYLIHIVKPEEKTQVVIIMPCEALNMINMQRNNRKRIIFS